MTSRREIRIFNLGGPCIIFSRRALRVQDDRKTTTTRLSRGRTLCVSVINYEGVAYSFRTNGGLNDYNEKFLGSRLSSRDTRSVEIFKTETKKTQSSAVGTCHRYVCMFV